MARSILAIDQGTTSSRAIIFDENRQISAIAQREFTQIFPDSGWVEHDAGEILKTVLETCREAIGKSGCEPADIAAIGITNQRETTVLWDRRTGEPIYNAIVWQDRRTAELCTQLKTNGLEPIFAKKTGLLLDPYFSGTKIRWLLDNVDGARGLASQGHLAFGTIDSFLIWHLSGGEAHVTDATNASRTLCFNIHTQDWDNELLEIFDLPASLFGQVKDCAAEFAVTAKEHFGSEIPILGVAGDQHAATIGQACFKPGMMKSTYGTGCFAMLNTGEEAVFSKNRLLTTIAYRLDGTVTYALEGSIFIAGAAVQWLRDGLGIIESASQSGMLAEQADENQDVYMVPAFTGLGAPWWDSEARGAIFGLTRNTTPAELSRAALEAVCYQTHDLLDAMSKDIGQPLKDSRLRVDGGMVASDWTMQRLADLIDAPIDRPPILESTAMGAAWLAGSKAGIWPQMSEFSKNWEAQTTFIPNMDKATRQIKIAGWRKAVSRTLSSRQ